jgi:hypothetical protein
MVTNRHFRINANNPGNIPVTVTSNYSSISCCSSTKVSICEIKYSAIIASIRTWIGQTIKIQYLFTLDWRRFWIFNWRYAFRIAINFQNIVRRTIYGWGVRQNGCGSNRRSLFIDVLKFFTPNGDNYNDTWKINFQILNWTKHSIFDRLSKLIKD